MTLLRLLFIGIVAYGIGTIVVVMKVPHPAVAAAAFLGWFGYLVGRHT
jgi:xanthosine utilization system XapX-like protein